MGRIAAAQAGELLAFNVVILSVLGRHYSVTPHSPLEPPLPSRKGRKVTQMAQNGCVSNPEGYQSRYRSISPGLIRPLQGSSSWQTGPVHEPRAAANRLTYACTLYAPMLCACSGRCPRAAHAEKHRRYLRQRGRRGQQRRTRALINDIRSVLSRGCACTRRAWASVSAFVSAGGGTS